LLQWDQLGEKSFYMERPDHNAFGDEPPLDPRSFVSKLRERPRSGADPTESPFYNRVFQGAYKGATRGMLGGMTLFGLFGAVIGLGVGAFSSVPLLLAMPLFAGIGMLFGKDLFGEVGTVAGGIATGLEVIEERQRARELLRDDPNNPELVALVKNGHDPYDGELPPKRMFHPKITAIGFAVGAGATALLIAAASAFAGGIPAVAGMAVLGLELTIPTVAAVVAGGLAGASYGLDRYYLRKWFGMTNSFYESKPHQHPEVEARYHMLQNTYEQSVAQHHAETPAPISTPAEENIPTTRIAADSASKDGSAREVHMHITLH